METHRSVVKKFDRSPSDFARILDHPNVDVEYETLYTKNTKKTLPLNYQVKICYKHKYFVYDLNSK